MKKLLLLIITITTVIGSAMAQSITVSGVVTMKDDGEPAIGAAVQVKGTNKGTITDLDGKYSITVEKGQTLVYRYANTRDSGKKRSTQRHIVERLQDDGGSSSNRYGCSTREEEIELCRTECRRRCYQR